MLRVLLDCATPDGRDPGPAAASKVGDSTHAAAAEVAEALFIIQEGLQWKHASANKQPFDARLVPIHAGLNGRRPGAGVCCLRNTSQK